MARKSTGQIIVRDQKGGRVYAARVRAYGKRPYVTLGTAADGWTPKRAEEELENILADVRRGIWRPPSPELVPEPDAHPDFRTFASQWYARRELEGLKPRSLEHLRWALTDHLLPQMHHRRLDEITPQVIDQYTAAKVKEGRLSNGSINTTVGVLGSILELAVEYGLITTNPASGRRRRLPTRQPTRAQLEPAQVDRLLAAAAELDADDRTHRPYREPLLATLAFAGLRVGEMLALRWLAVDLAAGHLSVREAKTNAGVRRVDIQPELRERLSVWKMRTKFVEPDDLVFPTGTGRPNNRNNVRKRVLLRAVERANSVDRDGSDALPDGLSPHALRRTFASMLVAAGEDIAYVMGQLGHTDPKMTLGLYARALQSKRRRAAGTISSASSGSASAQGPADEAGSLSRS